MIFSLCVLPTITYLEGALASLPQDKYSKKQLKSCRKKVPVYLTIALMLMVACRFMLVQKEMLIQEVSHDINKVFSQHNKTTALIVVAETVITSVSKWVLLMECKKE